MKLNQIFPETNDIEISQLLDDSRVISNQGMYFARVGLVHNGHNYIAQAIENGAVAIVHSEEVDHKQEGIEYILVKDVVSALHHACNVFFNYPSHRLNVHGVTGTNGKSTTMKVLYNLMRSSGIHAGYIGTVSVEYGDIILAPTLSTPDILELQTLLYEMAESGVTDVCLEVSSQGLDLRRVEGIKFQDASFTNLSHDHLDYHHTMESYFIAKRKFFEDVDPDCMIIVNVDDEYAKRILNMNHLHQVSYGIHEKADYQAVDVQYFESHTEFNLKYKGTLYPIVSNFVAEFNVHNILNVIAILHENGMDLELIIPLLKDAKGVEGRLELIDEGQNFQVYVDYAHSPDSFEILFQYLNTVKKPGASLVAVFGAQGSRDAAKRPIMGAIATQYCDHVVFTEVDNRFEEVEDVIADVVAGAVSDNYEIVVSRKGAICKAIHDAQENDIIVILGKGHEDVIQRGSIHEPYLGDHVVARNVLKGEHYEIK